MSAPLRELLKASGLSTRDIDEAVTQARGVTRSVEFWGGILQKGLDQLASHPKVNRMRPALVLSSVLVEKVTHGASEMLKKR